MINNLRLCNSHSDCENPHEYCNQGICLKADQIGRICRSSLETISRQNSIDICNANNPFLFCSDNENRCKSCGEECKLVKASPTTVDTSSSCHPLEYFDLLSSQCKSRISRGSKCNFTYSCVSGYICALDTFNEKLCLKACIVNEDCHSLVNNNQKRYCNYDIKVGTGICKSTSELSEDSIHSVSFLLWICCPIVFVLLLVISVFIYCLIKSRRRKPSSTIPTVVAIEHGHNQICNGNFIHNLIQPPPPSYQSLFGNK